MDLTSAPKMTAGELLRWFGSTYTMYEPGTGRIVAASNSAATGVQVTVETALAIPAFFHGLRTIGQTIGSLSFDLLHHLTTKNEDGVEQMGMEVARMHPVHTLLHSEPNEFQNASEWRETMIAHAVATGNGYSYIERNGNFRPTALLPLLPGSTKPLVVHGQLTYATTVNGTLITLDPWNVFHIKGFSWNGISGIPLIQLMRNALGLDIATAQFAAAFFGNGANLGGVVTLNGALSDVARQNLKSSMQREYAGVGNAFRTLFLEEGMKYEANNAVEPDKAQLLESRKFSLGDMSRVIGLPPHLLYDLSQSTNNNIEHQGIEAVTYAFNPWCNKFIQEGSRKLLYESEKFGYSLRLDTRPLMAGDSAAQAVTDTARFQSAAATPNEIRAKDGRNPIAGGDTVFINTAMMPLGLAIARIEAQTARLIAAPLTVPPVTITPVPANDGKNTEADEGDTTPPALPGAGIKPADGLPGPAVPSDLVPDVRFIRTNGPHSYSCVMAPIGGDAASAMLALANAIPDDELADDGRENDPHVTVLYGLHDDNAAAVRSLMKDQPPVKMSFGKTKVFPATADRASDVVVVDVESYDLNHLNSTLKQLPHVDKFPTYQPHATVAYVKPGMGDKYAGRSVDVQIPPATVLTHSNSQGVKQKIILSAERAFALAPVLRDALTRIIRREYKMVDAALKKHASDPPAVRTWLATFEPQQRAHVAEVLQPFCEAAAAAGNPMQTRIASFIESHLTQSRRAIEQVLAADPQHRDDARWSALNEKARIDQAVESIDVSPAKESQ